MGIHFGIAVSNATVSFILLGVPHVWPVFWSDAGSSSELCLLSSIGKVPPPPPRPSLSQGFGKRRGSGVLHRSDLHRFRGTPWPGPVGLEERSCANFALRWAHGPETCRILTLELRATRHPKESFVLIWRDVKVHSSWLYGFKIKELELHGCSLCHLPRVPFWVPIFDPQPWHKPLFCRFRDMRHEMKPGRHARWTATDHFLRPAAGLSYFSEPTAVKFFQPGEVAKALVKQHLLCVCLCVRVSFVCVLIKWYTPSTLAKSRCQDSL